MTNFTTRKSCLPSAKIQKASFLLAVECSQPIFGRYTIFPCFDCGTPPTQAGHPSVLCSCMQLQQEYTAKLRTNISRTSFRVTGVPHELRFTPGRNVTNIHTADKPVYRRLISYVKAIQLPVDETGLDNKQRYSINALFVHNCKPTKS